MAKLNKHEMALAREVFSSLVQCGAVERLKKTADSRADWDEDIAHQLTILTGLDVSPNTPRHLRGEFNPPISWWYKERESSGELFAVSPNGPEHETLDDRIRLIVRQELNRFNPVSLGMVA